ncbi:GspH/FimT family pseudopilin [Luteimonas sp. A478]
MTGPLHARHPLSSPRVRTRGCAGFTLVELMVVLAIVGLLGSVILLTAASPEAALRREADMLAARLVRAQQEAILSTRAVRVEVDPAGYRFHVARSGGWQPLGETPFDPVAWPTGVAPALPDDAGAMWFMFDPIGTAEPLALDLADGRGALRVQVDAGGAIQVLEAR